MLDVDRYGVMCRKSAPMMATPTSATKNVQVKAGRLANWTAIVFLLRWLTGVPLIACSIGLLDAGCAYRVGRTFGLGHRNGGDRSTLVATGLGCSVMESAGLIGLGITSGVDESSVSDCFLDGGGHLSAGRGILGISRIAIRSVPSGFRSCRCLS
ncbi:Large ribosomal subunit protein [Trichinella spiralis]|uniref:Large ribosomal subunit protein n=1 Tax=Trichinella spiralis TaxID=6334 RepID=A0ABR3KM69_TRISP